MKPFVLPLLLVCMLLGTVHVLRSEEGAAPRNASDVAVIDMDAVFKSNHHFEELRSQLKNDIEACETQANKMVPPIESLKREHRLAREAKDFDKSEELAVKLSRATDEHKKYVKDSQERFFKQEAEIYRTVDAEIVDVIKAYCQERAIKLVLQVKAPSFQGAPKEYAAIRKQVTREVVYAEGRDVADLDITGEIIRRVSSLQK